MRSSLTLKKVQFPIIYSQSHNRRSKRESTVMVRSSLNTSFYLLNPWYGYTQLELTYIGVRWVCRPIFESYIQRSLQNTHLIHSSLQPCIYVTMLLLSCIIIYELLVTKNHNNYCVASNYIEKIQDYNFNKKAIVLTLLIVNHNNPWETLVWTDKWRLN